MTKERVFWNWAVLVVGCALVIDVSAPISYKVDVNFYYLFNGDPFTTHTGLSYLRNIGSEGFSLSEVVLRVIRLATSIYVVSIASSGFL